MFIFMLSSNRLWWCNMDAFKTNVFFNKWKSMYFTFSVLCRKVIYTIAHIYNNDPWLKHANKCMRYLAKEVCEKMYDYVWLLFTVPKRSHVFFLFWFFVFLSQMQQGNCKLMIHGFWEAELKTATKQLFNYHYVKGV